MATVAWELASGSDGCVCRQLEAKRDAGANKTAQNNGVVEFHIVHRDALGIGIFDNQTGDVRGAVVAQKTVGAFGEGTKSEGVDGTAIAAQKRDVCVALFAAANVKGEGGLIVFKQHRNGPFAGRFGFWKTSRALAMQHRGGNQAHDAQRLTRGTGQNGQRGQSAALNAIICAFLGQLLA